jgi:hypothetical protein
MADEQVFYPFWICMKGRSKTGGKVCGIARTENERNTWEFGSPANWVVSVDADDHMFSEPLTGFEP